jgi:GT2 family glycosyltransferase/glycosyltransferase involved in cell wall biosynthesis
MNFFSHFEAHRNPLVRLMEKIGEREKMKSYGLPERLISLLGKTVGAVLPALFSVEGFLSGIYLKIRGRKDSVSPGERKKEVSVVILNWNGEVIIRECLFHLDRALKNTPGEHEVIVVDNNSTDRSVELLRNDFPWVKVIEAGKNSGFSRGNNIGVKAAGKDLVMLLNNDVLLSEETFTRLLEHFDDEKVFAVAPKVVLEDGSLNEGHSWGEFRNGMLLFYNERQSGEFEIIDKPSVTLYPIGACAVVDRRLYWELGGLDTMLSPFYWEDDDLGYRSLKRGYKVIYDPNVKAVHKNAVSSAKLPPAYITAVKEKNMLLFLWKNLTYKPYVKEYLRSLPRRIDIAVKRGNYSHLMAYILAFMQAGEMVRRRILETPWNRLSDKEALSLTRKERKIHHVSHDRPHILLITPFPPYPLNNGGALRVYNLTRNLNRQFDFSLLCFAESRAQTAYIKEYKHLFRDVHLIERKPTPVETMMKSDLPDNYSHYICHNMTKRIQDILSSNGVDIVQVEFPWMAYYGSFAHNRPSIFVEHDVGNMFFGKSFIRPEKGLKRVTAPLRAINYESLFMDSYDRVITVTEKDQKIMNVLFPSAGVTTVETGVDTDEFPYCYRNDTGNNLVYLGSYRHYPNEDAVVYFVEEIFPLIKARDKDVKLTLVGSHPTRRINRLKGREDIVITGTVPDVRKYLQEGTVFIAPIRLGGGIKGKILEALAVGLPVVATPLAATGIGAIDGENILIAKSPEQFAAKVSDLLSDAPLREKLSLNGRRLIEERFDWKVLAKKMEEVYAELT